MGCSKRKACGGQRYWGEMEMQGFNWSDEAAKMEAAWTLIPLSTSGEIPTSSEAEIDILNESRQVADSYIPRAKASTNQLHLTASTIKPDIILVQEQYHYNNEIPGIPNSWKTFSSTNQKAAILIPSAQIKPALLATKVNVVAVKIQTSSYPITIISAYSSPAQDVSTTLQEIQEIITSLPEKDYHRALISWAPTPFGGTDPMTTEAMKSWILS
ncbi:hypothetical protein HNY73_015377 [Argiope bruennichi]|uniref:Endonuclease/exonuclease/phosphatase domain-containing protein n=1 Tax=Argiope bruennichi TaxID=94029 RepID=A0A8T0ESF6_ARGBR|nr:hypothetical protein HNY73_015377 [Argiope bruennichi]